MMPLEVPVLEVGCAPRHASIPLPPLAAQEVALVVVQLNDVD
jgi:hypothetical protein